MECIKRGHDLHIPVSSRSGQRESSVYLSSLILLVLVIVFKTLISIVNLVSIWKSETKDGRKNESW